ncbi:MAG: ParB/RepB/Spo0J family partition protein [Candidatus Kerfeldbacteria bacterium]|nr:ParB/RepB/Spo0J family partition protein [Candidatus Kerfeldbacteria bacterium]
MSAKPFQLGRGLSSLIPSKPVNPTEGTNYWGGTAQDTPVASGERVQQVPLNIIQANPRQMRQHFDHAALDDLVASIKVHGIVQPLIVSPRPEGGYYLIAGERRLRAAEVAELKTVPVIVREARQQEQLELALIENIQRQDLNPLEEAAGYLKLQDEFGLKQEEIARRVGRSRSQVANLLRLFQLPPEIQEALRQGKITLGHAKVILSLPAQSEQQKFFKQIANQGLSVHLAELQSQRVRVRGHERQVASQPPEVRGLEQELQRALGTKVKVRSRGQHGLVEIMFYSLEELVGLVKRIAGK